MSNKYIPLYRKYRPKNLAEVVGQEHVKKALSNAITLNKISHAYLFTGPRGTGKTSVARILAKSLNCQEGPTLTPCEKCPSCLDIKNSTPMDVIEIDAASNRKVEDTQNILEKIQYVPVNGKYKIYIIDEVHMLTTHAFNALLKTLEEPPENVIFILATTEPQKVLETIISRCQRFDFRRITTDDIVKHLKYISDLENIKIDDDALFTIAKNAAGGMRDSLALLDQVSVLDASKTITSEDINKLLGRLSFDVLNQLTDYIIQSQTQNAIELLDKIYNSGNEPTQILINILTYLKNLLIVKNCTKKELLLNLTQLNENQIKVLKEQSEKIETQQITFLTEKTAEYIKELKTNTNQHLWLEIAIIDLANLSENTSLLELQERISRLEAGEAKPLASPAYNKSLSIDIEKPQIKPDVIKEEKTKSEIPDKKEINKEFSPVKPKVENSKAVSEANLTEENSPMPMSKQPDKNSLKEHWIILLQNISSTPTVSLLTQHTRPIEISEEQIVIGCRENFLKLLSSESKKTAIEEAANKIFNKNVNIIIKSAVIDKTTEDEKKNPIIKTDLKKNPVIEQEDFSIDEKDDNAEDEENEFIEHELAKKQKKTKEIAASDQVNMIMQLFDGKYID